MAFLAGSGHEDCQAPTVDLEVMKGRRLGLQEPIEFGELRAKKRLGVARL
jgi:hypothetical protein